MEQKISSREAVEQLQAKLVSYIRRNYIDSMEFAKTKRLGGKMGTIRKICTGQVLDCRREDVLEVMNSAFVSESVELRRFVGILVDAAFRDKAEVASAVEAATAHMATVDKIMANKPMKGRRQPTLRPQVAT